MIPVEYPRRASVVNSRQDREAAIQVDQSRYR